MKILKQVEEQRKRLDVYQKSLFSLLLVVNFQSETKITRIQNERIAVIEYLKLLIEVWGLIRIFPHLNVELDEDLTEFHIRCFLKQIENMDSEHVQKVYKMLKK